MNNKKSLFDIDLTDEEIGDMVDSLWYNEKKVDREPKCECGSEKTYGRNATHVYWCPKYKNRDKK